jgi:uncharacterized membrane protein YccC
MSALVSNSHILEHTMLASCLAHALLLLLLPDTDTELRVILYFLVLLTVLVCYWHRGVRIHVYPLIIAFTFYTLCLIFGILE